MREMLRELRIENLLLIERAELRFEQGVNVITGETGAGKTVLAQSLDLLLGGRPRSGVVRPGAPEAWVEGAFDLEPELRADSELAELLERVPDGEEVVLARRVSAAGRSSAFVAGRAATAADLRLLGSRLLAFYGQHEHRKLALTSAQGEILDSFAGPEHLELRAAYRVTHQRFQAARRELQSLREREGARERDLDLLRFELAEIEELAPGPSEGEELAAERDRLRGVEGLREASAAATLLLAGGEEGGGAASLLAEAESALRGPTGVDPELDGLRNRLGGAGLELSDLAAELRAYLDSLQADPERLEQLESRLAAIDRLVRKHGGTVAAVLAHGDSCREEIGQLETAAERTEALEAEIEEAETERTALGERLSASRGEATARLETAVAAELAELAMEGATFEVSLRVHPDGYRASGRESVEMMVATNPGMPTAPLGETASGGELSRVMLALSGQGQAEQVETLVFDEIDAGIGGKVARRVGERLRDLGERRQVICITHLPQVASLAAAHFRVEKQSGEGSTTATVERVGGEDLVAEIVRMLGADGGDEAADRHARELLAA
jgi:DNA repair protein RecN (Recombination protein N)